jgi:hypothetical protein
MGQPKGKIYVEATSYTPLKDSEYVANEYAEHARVIARCISKLNDMKMRIEYLHEITNDNADVASDLDTAITKLGIALASCVEYGNEYKDEANGLSEDEITEKVKQL